MAKGKIRTFTDEELAMLSRVMERERTSRINDPSKPPMEQGTLNEFHQAPEVYVARIPQPGIPPLTVVNPGDDKVFSKECDIYKLEYDTSEGQMKLGHCVGFKHLVYNVSQDWVDSLYAIIRRDKYGHWVVECPCVDLTGTGSGTGSGTDQPLNKYLCCATVCDTTGRTNITDEVGVLYDTIDPAYSSNSLFLLNPFTGEVTVNVEGGGTFAISFMTGIIGDPAGGQGWKTWLERDNGTETWNVVKPEVHWQSGSSNNSTHGTSLVIIVTLIECEKIRVRFAQQNSNTSIVLEADRSYLSICKVCCECSPAITECDTGTGTASGTPEATS